LALSGHYLPLARSPGHQLYFLFGNMEFLAAYRRARHPADLDLRLRDRQRARHLLPDLPVPAVRRVTIENLLDSREGRAIRA